MSKHTAPDDIERYLLGRVSDREGQAIETHSLTCAQCQEEMVKAQYVIDTIRYSLGLPSPDPNAGTTKASRPK
jgi:hypothetical protein